jgi:hypothetical protein
MIDMGAARRMLVREGLLTNKEAREAGGAVFPPEGESIR